MAHILFIDKGSWMDIYYFKPNGETQAIVIGWPNTFDATLSEFTLQYWVDMSSGSVSTVDKSPHLSISNVNHSSSLRYAMCRSTY